MDIYYLYSQSKNLETLNVFFDMNIQTEPGNKVLPVCFSKDSYPIFEILKIIR